MKTREWGDGGGGRAYGFPRVVRSQSGFNDKSLALLQLFGGHLVEGPLHGDNVDVGELLVDLADDGVGEHAADVEGRHGGFIVLVFVAVHVPIEDALLVAVAEGDARRPEAPPQRRVRDPAVLHVAKTSRGVDQWGLHPWRCVVLHWPGSGGDVGGWGLGRKAGVVHELVSPGGRGVCVMEWSGESCFAGWKACAQCAVRQILGKLSGSRKEGSASADRVIGPGSNGLLQAAGCS